MKLATLLATRPAWTRLDPRRLGWSEAVALAALLTVAGSLWAFAALTDEVLEGETHAFDETVLLALRDAPDDPVGPRWLEDGMRDLTALGGYPVIGLMALVAVGYLAVRRLWGSALLVPVVIAAGVATNQLMKAGFGRARPELVAHIVEVRTLSYPSGHAMLSAIVYLTLGVLLAEAQRGRRAQVYVMAVAVGLALVVGASRVYLGVHWPTDVLAGWSVGAAFALGIWLLLRRGPWAWRLVTRRSAGPAQDEPGADAGRQP